ncbi:hypothetical protein PM082_014331 [Marasmius tenuissimus]|nr:hypothetical protein PM082_014331 [Marasmius tenuissimus]
MEETALIHGAVGEFIRVLEAPSLQRLSTLGLGGIAYQEDDDDEELVEATDTLFRTLTWSRVPGQQVLPRLQRLALHGPEVVWTEKACLEMLSSRIHCHKVNGKPGTCSLEQFALCNFTGAEGLPLTTAKMLRWLDLAENGLVLTLAWGSYDWDNLSQLPFIWPGQRGG